MGKEMQVSNKQPKEQAFERLYAPYQESTKDMGSRDRRGYMEIRCF